MPMKVMLLLLLLLLALSTFGGATKAASPDSGEVFKLHAVSWTVVSICALFVAVGLTVFLCNVSRSIYERSTWAYLLRQCLSLSETRTLSPSLSWPSESVSEESLFPPFPSSQWHCLVWGGDSKKGCEPPLGPTPSPTRS